MIFRTNVVLPMLLFAALPFSELWFSVEVLVVPFCMSWLVVGLEEIVNETRI